jgi:hypothetical protein
MKKHFFVMLLLALATHAQEQKRLAILNTEDDGEPPIEFTDLNHLTKRLREIAVNVWGSIMDNQTITAKLGDNAQKECREARGCLAQLGRKLSADYIGQARLSRFSSNLTISMELYNSARGDLIASFTGEAKDVRGLLEVLNDKAPDLFKKIPGVSSGSKVISPLVAGGISGLQGATGYEFDGEKRYLVNLSTEPSGAVLSFDGVPSSSCVKTTCKAELREGRVRIIANLEQYEIADTTVSIKQNNQNINIKLKPNFGVLEIKPVYLDGIGKNGQWNLAINGKTYPLGEIRLSPNKYAVKLNHECYENIGFEAGINKGRREVFDMAKHIALKKGGLALSAEQNGKPASEPVFVNGLRVGETPFSGAVPLCAKVEIGKSKEAVNVKLKHNEKVKHTHKVAFNAPKASSSGYLMDARDGKKYKYVTIGKQTWMAENLNYNASGSKCYDNISINCDNYGRLYGWYIAMEACPSGWHLPNQAEWNVLTTLIGDFSALPGGYGSADGNFSNADFNGYWWSSSENGNYAYCRYYDRENAIWNHAYKSDLLSVRCIKDENDFTIFGTTINTSASVETNSQGKPFSLSAWTFSIYGTGVTFSSPIDGQEHYVNSISALLGLELIYDVSLFGAGLYIGIGSSPTGIIEYIFESDLKKVFWISEQRIALPISLGIGFRYQPAYIENRIAAEFINDPELLENPEGNINVAGYSFDIISAIDLQYFVNKRLSIYAGYMYRIANRLDWTYRNSGETKLPEQYAPFENPRERVGIPGVLRIGIKYNGNNGD